MSLNIKSLFGRLFRRPAPVPARAPRLTLEPLEARDVPATLTVSALGDLTEGGSAGGFRVTRDGDTSQALYVLVAAPGGTATAGSDYTGLAAFPSYLPIPAGASYADIYLTPIDDAAVEGTESISISVAEYSVAGPSGWASGTISLFDNDTSSGPPEPTVPTITAGTMMNATEGGMWGAFFLHRTGDTSGSLTVSYTVGGTATAGADYTALSGTATFAPDNAFAGVYVAALADALAEPTESVILYAQPGTGYTLGGTSSATLTVNDTNAPVVSVQSNGDALEGGTGGEFWFTRVGDLSSSLTVNFAVGGTATSGTDYSSIGTTVTFAAGESLAIVPVTADDDATFDPNETISATIQSGSGYSIGSANTSTFQIIDAATPFVTVAALTDGAEGGTYGTFRFTRTGSTAGTLTVSYTVSGDATAGTDYAALSGSVTFAAGSATADVTVTVTDDTDDEPTEFVSVSVTPNANYAIGSGSAVVSIADNDLPEVAVTKIVDAAETGGRGVFRFSRTLGDLSSELTVSYTVGGTATAGTDYAALSGSVTFAANATTVDVVVTPNADTSTESTETVSVTVSSGAAYTVGTGSASLNIREEAAGSVSGRFWIDTNGDGVRGTGEPGLAYSSVFLIQAGEVVAKTLTDENGDYTFSQITSGTYVVSFETLEGLTATTPIDKNVTIAAGANTGGVDSGVKQPVAFTPTGKRDGIDWSTLDLTSAENGELEGVTGHLHKVKTTSGKEIKVFLAHAMTRQSETIRLKYAGKEDNIKFNCNGLTFDLQHVRLANGSMASFSIIDKESAKVLLNEQYTPRLPADAKADLAAGKKVIGIYLNAGSPRQPVHSVILTKIVTGANGNIDLRQSTCASKNGWEQQVSATTFDIFVFYATQPRDPADRASMLVYFTLK